MIRYAIPLSTAARQRPSTTTLLWPLRSALAAAVLIGLAVPAAQAELADSNETQEDHAQQQPDGAEVPLAPTQALVALRAVTVTAERREADLLDTPLAVSAISAEQIERGRLESIRELLGTVPGLVTPGSIGNMQSLFVRGIGTSNPGFYPAVAFYIDDVYRPRPFGVGFFSLPDIERIEVLRGPQGTLYGQNSSGGALRLISRDPGDFPETRLGLGIGTDGYREASAYLARPIKQDVLSIGFAASSRRTDGFTYNAFLDKQVDALRLDQARLKLQLTPNENSSAVLALDLGRDQTDNALYIPVGYPGASPRVTFAAVDTRLDRKDRGVSLHYKHALGERLEFKSITASRWFDDDPSPWDQDGEPAFNEGWVQYIDQQQFSQEFQLSGQFERLSFTSGLVYFREHLLFDRLTHLSERYSELNSDLRSESRAIYGQLDYRLGDRLTATLGGRYSEDKQEFANESFRNTPTGERTAQVYSVAGLEDDWSSFTPKLGLSLDLNPDTLLYLSATRGEKIGGYNRAAATAQIASLPVGPEKVTAFESGWKQRYLDNRAQTTLAVFFNDFRDYQAAVSNPVVNGEFITGSVMVNAAEARTWGAELEAALKVSERLELSGSAAYLRSRFDDFENPTGAAATDFTGKELPTAPRWSFSANAVYDIPLVTRGRVSANAQVRYVSEQFSDIGNTPQLEVKPQTYVNAGLNWITGSPWSFSLTAKNLLDKTYAVNLKFRAGVSNQAAYNPPRQIVLGARYDF